MHNLFVLALNSRRFASRWGPVCSFACKTQLNTTHFPLFLPPSWLSTKLCSVLSGGPPLKELLADRLKKFYLNKIKGWKEEDLCGCTLVFEGTTEEVNTQRNNIYKAAKLYGALPAGSSNGERGYQMTFLIAYLR